jgi:hypothetical protein
MLKWTSFSEVLFPNVNLYAVSNYIISTAVYEYEQDYLKGIYVTQLNAKINSILFY